MQAAGLNKAVATGRKYDDGANRKLTLDASAPPAATRERAERKRTPNATAPAPGSRPAKREGDPLGAAAGLVSDRSRGAS